jgi:hypothetical protein
LNFFLDNNLPPSWSPCLSACCKSQFSADEVGQVVHLKERFDASTQDVDWINALAAEKNWTILSGDGFRKGNGIERKVLRQSGLSVFVLQKSWSNYAYWEKTAHLLLWWPRMVAQANAVERFAMEVPWRTAGKFNQL